MHSFTDTGTCNLMNHCKTTKNLTIQTFTVTQSHTGTIGSNVMVHITVNFVCVSCIEFPNKMSFEC